MYKIIVTPSLELLKKSSPVTKFDKKLAQIISGMKQTLNATVDPVGVGLAAPQIGVLKRIFLSKPADVGEIMVFINPEIVKTGNEQEIPNFTNSPKIEAKKPKKSKGRLLEGCLSLPNIWGNVSRKKKITLKYQDEKGLKYLEVFSSFPAIIIQHELDHLDGILFTKHVLEQAEQLYRSYKNEKGEDEFEEIEV